MILKASYIARHIQKKNNILYTYYISQNLLQYRTHRNSILARIPAYEIEKIVIYALRGWITDIQKLKKAFPEQPQYYLELMVKNPMPINRRFTLLLLEKVTVHTNYLVIKIDAKNLCQEIKRYYEIAFNNSSKTTIEIKKSFKAEKTNNGAISLKSNEKNNKGPFDIPSNQLKRVVRGTIWRDQHFAGRTLKSIANTEGYGENYVNKCVRESLIFLNKI